MHKKSVDQAGNIAPQAQSDAVSKGVSMRHDPELEQLINAVIDGLTAIHGWATLAVIPPRDPKAQEQALDFIQVIARQTANRIQAYMRDQPPCATCDPH